MSERTSPKKMGARIAKLLRKENPDYNYVKKIFAYVRQALELEAVSPQNRRLPELLVDDEMLRFYEAVWNGAEPAHMVMIKLLLYTGIRNSELTAIAIRDVDLKGLRIRIEQGKGKKDRYVPIPESFRGELAQFVATQKKRGADYLFESRLGDRFSTRWISEIVKRYARQAGIEKRIYPHLFRHQLLTHLTKKGLLDAKIQLLSGHSSRQSLAIYQSMSLADVAADYQEAMRDFPVK